MKLCVYCNHDNSDDSQYCTVCGKVLPSIKTQDTNPLTNAQGQAAYIVPRAESAPKHTAVFDLKVRAKARWWSFTYLISGIVSLALGIKSANEWFNISVKDVEFGADFYTDIYHAVREIVNGAEDIAEFLAFGVGALLIAFSLFLFCNFFEKFFSGEVEGE